MGLLKKLFVLTIFILPFGNIARLQFTNNINFTLIDFSVGIIASAYILFLIYKKKFPQTFLNKPILIFIIACLVSLIVNIDSYEPSQLLVSSMYLFRWISYALIFFVVFQFDEKFKQKIPLFLIISGFVVVLGGFIQYFFYQNLRNLYYLGWDNHLYRMFSSFLDPNFFATILVLCALLIVSHFYLHNQTRNIVTGTLLLFPVLIALYLTFSRSGILMFLTSFSLLLVLIQEYRKLAGSAIFIVILLAINNPYIENVNLFRSASIEARVESFSNAITIIKDNPVFGIGFNAYRYAQVKYSFRTKNPPILSHADAGTDNSFVFVLATAGIVGLCAYIYLWYKVLNKSYNYYSNNKKYTFQKTNSLVVVSSLSGLLVNSFFINSLFYPSVMFWMWVLVGLVYPLRKGRSTENN